MTFHKTHTTVSQIIPKRVPFPHNDAQNINRVHAAGSLLAGAVYFVRKAFFSSTWEWKRMEWGKVWVQQMFVLCQTEPAGRGWLLCHCVLESILSQLRHWDAPPVFQKRLHLQIPGMRIHLLGWSLFSPPLRGRSLFGVMKRSGISADGCSLVNMLTTTGLDTMKG